MCFAEGRTMNNADFNEMVLNPIYDGPMYETILKVNNLKEQPSNLKTASCKVYIMNVC